MKLFISIEAEKATESGIADILNKTRNKLSFLFEDTDIYGTEFDSVSIIPTCVSEEIWKTLGWKERKFISRKKKEADIRLKMNYDRFVSETYENKYSLFKNVLIESVREINVKSKGDFNGEKLINDILNALEH